MLDLSSASQTQTCATCRTELPPLALVCPNCATFVHRERLRDLAHRAETATAAGDCHTARAHWLEAQTLLPPATAQYAQVAARLAALRGDASASSSQTAASAWGAWGGGSVAGIALAVGLLLAGKLKFLLFGLGKLSTVASMFGFIAVYWSIHGWPLAAGLAGSIYVHEMGHVAMLRRLGIQAGAPLFVPGMGAFVLLRERITDPVTDARIGLAGPVWGLGAAVASYLVYAATGAGIWLAIAELTGFINLFNLAPVWQLDGARGFHALSGRQRWLVVAAMAATLWMTDVRLLWIVGAVAVYRAWRSEPGPGHAPTLLTFTLLIVALSWFARAVR